MKPLSLATLAELAGAKVIRGNGERVAFGVSIDSRSIKPGELFVAIRGPKNDGHDHLAEAAERGAIAAMVQKQEVGKVPVGFSIGVGDGQFRQEQHEGDAGRRTGHHGSNPSNTGKSE